MACGVVRCRNRNNEDKEAEEKKVHWGEKEEGVVVVATATTKGASAAPLVLFERPLMELTLADLVAATFGFSCESRLAVAATAPCTTSFFLPGDLHVVMCIVEGPMVRVGEDDNPAVAAAVFRELARLRLPNILSLLGYYIADE